MTVVGVDLGGSKTAIGAVADGAVQDRVVIESRGEEGPEAWADRAAAAISGLARDAGAHPVRAIGVGVAGQVDDHGRLALAPNLGWSQIDMAALLADRTGLPVRLLGDVQATAMGEWLYGAGRGARNMAAVFLGTGVGAGVIIDGRLRRGAGGSLGEVGHMKVSLDGPACTCGDRGCLEAFAGGWALAERARERIRDGQATTLSADTADAPAVAAAARDGDPVAREVIEDAARALGAGLVSILHAYNPAVVVFGGGVATGIPELVNRAVDLALARALPAPAGDAQFAMGSLGVDAGVLGAAGWAALA